MSDEKFIPAPEAWKTHVLHGRVLLKNWAYENGDPCCAYDDCNEVGDGDWHKVPPLCPEHAQEADEALIEKLRAENTRLREALASALNHWEHHCRDCGGSGCHQDSCVAWHRLQEARAALTEIHHDATGPR